MIVNSKRGEVAINIDGEDYKLCLTLGALAELETLFKAQSLEDLGIKLGAIGANDIIDVILILLKGGGNYLTKAALESANLNVRYVAAKIAECFEQCQ